MMEANVVRTSGFEQTIRALDVAHVSGIGKLVEDGHMHIGRLLHNIANKRAAAKAAAARKQDVLIPRLHACRPLST